MSNRSCAEILPIEGGFLFTPDDAWQRAMRATIAWHARIALRHLGHRPVCGWDRAQAAVIAELSRRGLDGDRAWTQILGWMVRRNPSPSSAEFAEYVAECPARRSVDRETGKPAPERE